MRFLPLAAALTAAGILAACGGGGDTAAPAAPNQPSNPASITLTGVVAKGAALAGASVEAKCAAGVGTATTTTTGSYSITITSGALPCVLEAVALPADGGMVLHSVATTGAPTANITPLTELLVAQLTGQDPALYMDNVVVSTLATAVTTTTVNTAQTAVVNTLTAAGVDTTGLASTSLVSGTLVAASSGVSGNAYDQVLDSLASTIASAGTSLTALTTTVANTSAGSQGSTDPVAESSNPLPANLLLLPKAENCAALRSTNYRLIKLASSAGTSGVSAIETMSINAATLTATFGDASTTTLVANGNCRYTLPDLQGEAMVSPAGVMVIRALVGADDDSVGVNDRDKFHMILGLPVQSALAVGDLAGSWNFIGMNRETTATPSGGTLTITASGVITGNRCFGDTDTLATLEADCSVDTGPAPALAAHADGGFTLTSSDLSDPWVDRIFTFKAGNGELMLLSISGSGEFAFGTRQRTLSLPAVNDASTTITMLVDKNLVAGNALSSASHTIASAEAGTVVRNSTASGDAAAHQETLVYNTARTGYLTRTGSSAARPFTALPLQGVGLTAIYMPATATNANAFFALSVRQ
ncbi:MAG TPA: hypothetical protein VHQ87_08855 [Rhizobacter sp.]|nr:hypothetical protein [Rhizobacter sp.]